MDGDRVGLREGMGLKGTRKRKGMDREGREKGGAGQDGAGQVRQDRGEEG